MRLRCIHGGLLALVLAVGVAGLVAVGPAEAQLPLIDGNINDLKTYATTVRGVVGTDESADPCRTAFPQRTPCSEIVTVGTCQTFLNGYDLTEFVGAYDRASGTFYGGIRVRGQVGDTDGDGYDGLLPGATCAQPRNMTDDNGIYGSEYYAWNLDTNCDGTPDVVIVATSPRGSVPGTTGPVTVRVLDGPFPTGQPIPGFSGTGVYNGHDIEVSVTGFQSSPLPYVWQLSAECDNNPDELSEDDTPILKTDEPSLDLTITKTANPLTACPGGPVSFTIEVCNTGEVPLTVKLTDELPTGFVCSPNVTGDFSLCGQNGQTLTFCDLEIPANQCRTVTLSCTMPDPCQGDYVNTARVTGSWDEVCLSPPGPRQVGPLEATATVTCLPKPCVNVTCDATPPTECNGPYSIRGCAQNCSPSDENITIVITGPAGEAGRKTFEAVPAGETVCLDLSLTCTEPGLKEYTVDATAANACGEVKAEPNCKVSVECPPCEGNCPRTVGFWGMQCAQKLNGSTKFTKDQVTQIAACIDANSTTFNWSAPFDGFCANINPSRPMDCKKQAHRQFAGLLANYCTGKLELIASNGAKIKLLASTPNPCKGSFPDAETIGDLIAAMDAKLAELDAAGADPQDQGYCMVSECADGINNGRGIPIDSACAEETSSPTSGKAGDVGLNSGGDTASGLALELYRPTPNPFTNSTTIAYAVGGNGQDVQIGIYDVAGRLVRVLASGFQAAGRYEVSWNGRTDDGAAATHGVYFIRALVGGERVGSASRILYLR